MAKLSIELEFDSNLDAARAKSLVSGNKTPSRTSTVKLANFLRACAGGLRKATYTLRHNNTSIWTVTCDASALQDGTTTLVIGGATLTAEAEPAYASGTITCNQAGAVATTDEVSIDGVSYASVAADPDVTAGEWLVGADDEEMAENIAAAINGIVPAEPFTAVASEGVVTVTADTIGTAGNVTFTETGSGMALSGSGNLTGGVAALGEGEFAIVLSGATDADDDAGAAESLKEAIEASSAADYFMVTRSANVLTIVPKFSGSVSELVAPTETGNGLTVAEGTDSTATTESYSY